MRSNEELEKLRVTAESIKDKLNPNRQFPVVIEFAGSPKSGKSTTIDTLVHFFKRTGFKVLGPTEGASKRTPYSLRKDLVAFNAWTLTYAIQELLVSCYNVENPYDLVILDRGPFDSLAWMSWLHSKGNLSEEEYETIRHFALHPKWIQLLSSVYLFTCTPECSLKRENSIKLINKPGTAMNVDTLGELLQEYGSLFDEFKEKEHVHVEKVDTTDSTSPLDTAYEQALGILNLLKEKQTETPIS